MNFRHAATLALAALLAQPAPAVALTLGGSSSKCDPTIQSCAPATGAGIGTGGGGGGGGSSCTPTPGGSPCGGAGPATQGNSSATDQGAGNPIHLINANKYQRETDMPALPGLLGLELVRHYNSQYSQPHVPPGMLGRGWLLSYEARIYEHDTNVQVVQADGSRIIFSKTPQRPSLCASQQPGQGIVQIEQGKTPQDKHYTWHWMDGRELRFNHRGRLTRIQAPSGERVQLQYNAQGTRLLQVTDPQGRRLRLHYGRQGQGFAGVQAIDTPMGRITYRHGSDPLPDSAQPPDKLAANLVQVLLPAGSGQPPVERTYHYEDPAHPTLMTGISVRGQGSDGQLLHERIASYAYGQGARAIASVRGPPGSARDRITLDLRKPWQNTLTNSDGQQTTYHYDTIAGQWRLTEARGPGCAGCSPGNMRYRYDAQGQLTESIRLDSQGRPVQAQRAELDHFGRPLAVYRIDYANGQPQAPQLQVRYGYGKNAWKQYGPELIARPSVVPGREHQIRIRYNDRRQPLEITESGFSPLDAQGQPAADAAQATPIERSTRYRYTQINGRSVLVDINGPLPVRLADYDHGTPAQDDLTRLRWDESASFVTRVLPPDGATVALQYNAAGLISRVSSRYAPAEGQAPQQALQQEMGHDTELRYDTQARLVAMRNLAPDGSVLQEQSWRYDALGHLAETGTGGWPDPGGAAYAAQARQQHDALGRLLWSANTQGRFALYSHDLQGQLQSITGPGGTVALPGPAPERAMHRATAPRQRPAHSVPAARQLHDDFGRSVATLSPDSGLDIRGYDEADRLVSGRDAMGRQARYTYDMVGRIQQQTITQASGTKDARAGTTTTTTRWHYQGPRLAALEHPTQSEHYEYDSRGMRTRTLITRPGEDSETGQDSQRHATRYAYDRQGRLAAVSLPDGSWLHYERDALGQITGLQRQRVQTPWLRWLHRPQTIASGLQRDPFGLHRWQAGNGIQALYQRSREGALARIVYRQPEGRQRPAPGLSSARAPWQGLGTAHAGEPPARSAAGAPVAQASPALQGLQGMPGALGLPQDPGALIDQRYLWDGQGNLLLRQDRDSTQAVQASYAYDGQERLIAEARRTGAQLQASRYHYDSAGRRVLDQQGVAPDDLRTATRAIGYQGGSHRWSTERRADAAHTRPAPRTDYNANGQPLRMGAREYRWDALGRLEEIREQGALQARYRYNHRGERIAKRTAQGQRAYLYEAGQLRAELDAQGRITRQYIHLGPLPLAVIDTPQGRSPDDGAGALWRIARDLGTIAGRWLGYTSEHIAWLHTNHLGAVEAATDRQGQLIWRARYTAFGHQQVLSRTGPFELPLRLPGQYFDAESGLHYNLHRYYDPDRGQYLTPDPLGTPDGPDPYRYVRHNPLRYIDPQGLILFAFDGTNNSNPPPKGDTVSNVYKFYLAYDEDANGKKWYMTGVGRDDQESGIKARSGDLAFAVTARERVDHMLKNLDTYIEGHDFADGANISIDIVGFSRGAAMSRDFANRVATRIGEKRWKEKSDCVELRFLGLWDTVAQFGANGADNTDWQLAIPPQVQYVFQAVALNEHRYLFPGENIHRGTQLGFIGSHSDIGGSFGTGDLSNVALLWIAEKARESGLILKDWADVGDANWGNISNPVLHDKSNNFFIDTNNPEENRTPEDSEFCQRDNNARARNCIPRKVFSPGGMTGPQSQEFITYRSVPGKDADGSSLITGDIKLKEYAQWLKENYGLTVALQ